MPQKSEEVFLDGLIEMTLTPVGYFKTVEMLFNFENYLGVVTLEICHQARLEIDEYDNNETSGFIVNIVYLYFSSLQP